jgi:hypothetical protein
MADTAHMSDAETTHASTTDGHDDGHGHAPVTEPLGPVDLVAWAYAGGGAVLGLVIALALFAARGG